MTKLTKIALSGIIVFYAILVYTDENGGVLHELRHLNLPVVIALIATFFIAIAFYCKTLQRCLALISPENRKTDPKSVWLMFLLPYNFIEDFFIILNISNSLEGEAKSNPKLAGVDGYGMVTGIGWCIAQILSLIPNAAGEAASLLALLLWVLHWRFIMSVNLLLAR